MSSKTADTEEETLESPTPPKTAPLSPDQREDDILEEEESDEVNYIRVGILQHISNPYVCVNFSNRFILNCRVKKIAKVNTYSPSNIITLVQLIQKSTVMTAPIYILAILSAASKCPVV